MKLPPTVAQLEAECVGVWELLRLEREANAALRARLQFFDREWTFRDTDYDDVDTVFKDELPITCDQADSHRHHIANAWNRLVAKSKEQA